MYIFSYAAHIILCEMMTEDIFLYDYSCIITVMSMFYRIICQHLDLVALLSLLSTQWSSVFPRDLKTEQKSVLFVKKLVAVGISTITYLRGIFPEVRT